MEPLAQERQRIVESVSRYARESSFRRQVMDAYRDCCAVTKTQLSLVDAAHIVPVVEEVFQIDGKYFLINHIPATVCRRCGDETFSRETAEKIRRMVHGRSKPKKSIPLKVFEFA